MHLCPFIAVHYSCCLFQWNRKSHYRWHQENFFVGKSSDILISPVPWVFFSVFFFLILFFWKTKQQRLIYRCSGEKSSNLFHVCWNENCRHMVQSMIMESYT